jgi:hypothetical protein
LNPEDVGESRPAVVAKSAEDKILALLVKYQYPGQHVGCECEGPMDRQMWLTSRMPAWWGALGIIVVAAVAAITKNP